MRLRIFITTALMAVLIGCNSAPPTPQLTLHDGVYWSSHYQSFLHVQRQVVTRYQWTPSQCWAADTGLLPRVFSTAADPGQHVWIGAGERTIVLQRRSDGLPVVFTREPMLPKHCVQAPTATAAIAVTALVEILEQFQHSLPAVQLLQWRAHAELLDRATGVHELDRQLSLFELLSQMLDHSGDEHAFLLAKDLERYHRVSQFSVGEAQRERARQQLLQELQSSSLRSSCDQGLWWGRLSSGEFYLGVTRLYRFSPEAAYSEMGQRCLQRALYAMADELKYIVHGQGHPVQLVIDLRFNEGGSLLLASQLANSLQPLTEPLAVIRRQAVDERRNPDLSGLHQGGKVLVTELTASAAEHLAHALQLRGFELHGQQTRGAFAPTTVKSLPNGWVVGISMYAPAEVVDGRGQALPEGDGLVPDVVLAPAVLFPPAQ